MTWPWSIVDDQFEFVSLNPEVQVLGASLEETTEEMGGFCDTETKLPCQQHFDLRFQTSRLCDTSGGYNITFVTIAQNVTRKYMAPITMTLGLDPGCARVIDRLSLGSTLTVYISEERNIIEESPVFNPWQTAYFRLELESQKTIVDMNITYVKTGVNGCEDAIILFQDDIVTSAGVDLDYSTDAHMTNSYDFSFHINPNYFTGVIQEVFICVASEVSYSSGTRKRLQTIIRQDMRKEDTKDEVEIYQTFHVRSGHIQVEIVETEELANQNNKQNSNSNISLTYVMLAVVTILTALVCLICGLFATKYLVSNKNYNNKNKVTLNTFVKINNNSEKKI